MDDRDEIREAFQVFDKDGTGYLNEEQVERLVRHVGEMMSDTEQKAMLDSFEFDEDGNIALEDFVNVIFNAQQ